VNRSSRQENDIYVSRYNYRSEENSIKVVGARLRNNLPRHSKFYISKKFKIKARSFIMDINGNKNIIIYYKEFDNDLYHVVISSVALI